MICLQNKKQLLVFALCCPFLLCCCHGRDKQQSGWSEVIAVETLVVNDSSSQCMRNYVGSIGSEIEMDLSFPLGGTLTKVAVSNGQKVKKGQTLAEVDATTATSVHNTALATLRQAEDAYNRLKKVHDEGGISDVRWIQMETDLEKAKQSEVASRKNMEQSVLKAPFDGVVSCTNRHVGQEMKPLENFARLINLHKLRISFSVPEQEVGLIGVGSDAQAVIPALNDRQLTLRITDKSLIANPLGHTYRVYGTIVNGSTEGLLPDMVAKVRIELDKSAGIVVPSKCVQIMPEGTIVWVVSGGKAYHRLVVVGDYVANGVLVSSGLNGGDTVIVSGHQKLYTGAKVEM